jgi:mono/diheme cytochrome c family protein
MTRNATNYRIAPLACAVLILTAPMPPAQAETLQQRGEALARQRCVSCHSISSTGDGRHPAAPRFRTLGDRLDLSALARRMRRGLLAGHEDMPMFRFSRDDGDAIVAYIRSIQGP